MKSHIRERVLQGANYMIENKCTIKEVAKEIGVSESTVSSDFKERLGEIDASLKKVVDEIISENMANGKIRGGLTMAARRSLEIKKANKEVEKQTYGQKIQKLKYEIDRVELDEEEIHMIHGILELSQARKNFNASYDQRVENIIRNRKAL